MENHDGLYFLPISYAELLLQRAGPYTSVAQELRMNRGGVARLAIEFVTLSEQVNSADLTFEKITILWDLLKYCSVCLS